MKKMFLMGLAMGTMMLIGQVAMAADVYKIDFEGGKSFITTASAAAGEQAPASPGVITDKKNEVISGAGSFKLDSMKSEIEWNEMYWSDLKQIKFEPNTTYTVEMDYKILEDDGNYFYFLMRSLEAGPGENDRGWTQWTGEEENGHMTATFDLGDYSDYYMDIGNHFTGAMTIDNIAIRKGE